MAASCISLSSTAIGSASSLAPAVSVGCKSRHSLAMSTAGLSRPLAVAESLSFKRALFTRSDWMNTSIKSYGGYGAESIDKGDWTPPPPNLDDLPPEPKDSTATATSDFVVPTPDERDFGGFRQDPPPNTKLYVGNIAWNVDSKMLADAFNSAGITELEEVNVMYDRMLGKSRGFAFVTLATEEAAKLGIEKLDGYELEGRPLRVNYPQVPRGGGMGGGFGGGFGERPSIPANPSKCFVANIPWSVDDQGLQEFFSSHGTVVDCRILTDADSGRSRGIGFVTMSTPEEANNAISALDGAELAGRSLRVALATGRQ